MAARFGAASMTLRIGTLVVLPLLASVSAVANDNDAFADLFGDTLTAGGKQGLQDLKDAAGQVKAKATDDNLAPKEERSSHDAEVRFLDHFAAERIQIVPKEGCIPASPRRIKLTYFEVFDVPGEAPKFSVCLKMSSRVNREVRVTATILNPRHQRAARAESVVSFARVQQTDHVLDFPKMPLTMLGPYTLSIDIDGRPVAKLPLFEVRQPS
ncbi:MAG: hypothetical protein ACO3JL_17040 [Myxococcota bacterium]